jgi:ribose transport system substrate-binding protein
MFRKFEVSEETGGPGRLSRKLMLLVAILTASALVFSACSSDDDSSSSSDSGSTTTAANGDAPWWCGDEPVTLGIQDGIGLNAWSKESLRQVKLEAAKCPSIEETIVVNAQLDPQKATSGIQSMVAQGADAIVIIPDAGVCAELPAMRQATQRGVTVAVWAADGCGEVPADYQSYSDWDTVANGETLTRWLAEQMGGKGNLAFFGGPAGNLVDQQSVEGMYKALEDYPDIKVLGDVSEENWPVTNWDPAEAQKVAAATLAKYPQIDGLLDIYGASVAGEIKAFEAAGREIPPIGTTVLNDLACTWEKRQGTDKEFDMAAISNRNWIGRLAVRQAVANVNDIENDDPTSLPLPIQEDSTDPDMLPRCAPGEIPDYDWTNQISDEEMDDLLADIKSEQDSGSEGSGS